MAASDEAAEPERGWSLAARKAGDGVRLEIRLPAVEGQPVLAALLLERKEARAFARALLAAAGDATERSFLAEEG